MLLRQVDGAVIAIGQASHAWVSGQLARVWDPRPEPYEAVCLAAEQHDVGMAQWDLLPTLNPATGLPTTFIELDLDTHVRLWSAAPARLLTQSRYAAVLVSLHGSRLYALRDLDAMDPDDADKIRTWEATQSAFRARLIAQLGADVDVLRAQQGLMWCWDSLSLGLLIGWETFTVEGITLRDGAVLDPWPLSVPELTVVCDGRRLEGTFTDEGAMRTALEAAEHVALSFTLRPPA
jgi:hypothetical protein